MRPDPVKFLIALSESGGAEAERPSSSFCHCTLAPDRGGAAGDVPPTKSVELVAALASAALVVGGTLLILAQNLMCEILFVVGTFDMSFQQIGHCSLWFNLCLLLLLSMIILLLLILLLLLPLLLI